MVQVAKAHAYGNDFLFVPMEQAEGVRRPELSRRLCDRHFGVGGDGVIYYTVAPDGTARMSLVNADGSASELSGNGLRCLAALVLHQREAAKQPGAPNARTVRVGVEQPLGEVRVDTDAGWKTLSLIGWQGSRYTFRAAMGPPERVVEETLDVGGETLTVTTLAIGNPQCVQLLPQLPDRDRFNRLGPALSTHQRFPQGTNVEFAVVEAPNRVRILIWERGVGPTHASGTGACAAAVAAIAHAGASRDVEVIAPGGSQRVEWRDDGIYLTGWAEVVFDGRWIPSLADVS